MTEFYSTTELARRWKVDPQRVSRMAARGELPAIRVGRQWRFFKPALHQWEQEHLEVVPPTIDTIVLEQLSRKATRAGEAEPDPVG